jgi:hypothetical protein
MMTAAQLAILMAVIYLSPRTNDHWAVILGWSLAIVSMILAFNDYMA